jgi:hypothetical protein
MRLHVDVLFIRDGSGHLKHLNVPSRPPPPLVYIGRVAGSVVCHYRQDLPDDLCGELNMLAGTSMTDIRSREPAAFVGAVRGLLKTHVAVGDVWAGPAYRFPEKFPAGGDCIVVDRSNSSLLVGTFDDYIPELELVQPCVVLLVDGRPVTICHSSRLSPNAAEAGIETLPAYRRRGLGAQAVVKWASLVREFGRTPLYSTSWENTASQGLAKNLRLVQYGTDLHLSERQPGS